MQPHSDSPSIEETLTAKGIAITLMLIHHLFAFPERLHGLSYISVIPMIHSPYATPEFYLGQLGKLCVPIFLFLSGFGMMERMPGWSGSRFRYALKKGGRFLGSYWTAFLIFVPVGLLFFQDQPRFQFSLPAFFLNFFALSYSYNAEWWFVRTYFLLLALFPLLSPLAEKYPRRLLGASLLLLLLSMKFTFIQNIFLHQASFVLGIVFSRRNFFKKFSAFFFPESGKHTPADLGILLLAARAFSGKELLLDPLLAIFAVTYTIRWGRAFPRMGVPFQQLGRYTLLVWLTHSFFCYYFFQPWVFAPKLSVLITLWLLFLALAASILISKIQDGISKQLPFPIRRPGGAA